MRGSHNPFLGFCWNGSQNSGKVLLIFSRLLKGMIKDTDEQPSEEFYRLRSGMVPSAGASVPVELDCTAPPAHGYVPPLEAPWTHYSWQDFYGSFLSKAWSIINSTSRPSPLSREVGVCRLKVSISNYGLVFLVGSQHPVPCKVTPLEQKRFLVLLLRGVYKGFRSPVSRAGGRI